MFLVLTYDCSLDCFSFVIRLRLRLFNSNGVAQGWFHNEITVQAKIAIKWTLLKDA